MAGEKMAAISTVEFLRREAAEGRRDVFDDFLAAVPDRVPEPGDELG